MISGLSSDELDESSFNAALNFLFFAKIGLSSPSESSRTGLVDSGLVCLTATDVTVADDDDVNDDCRRLEITTFFGVLDRSSKSSRLGSLNSTLALGSEALTEEPEYNKDGDGPGTVQRAAQLSSGDRSSSSGSGIRSGDFALGSGESTLSS